jgi:hypothetical protein
VIVVASSQLVGEGIEGRIVAFDPLENVTRHFYRRNLFPANGLSAAGKAEAKSSLWEGTSGGNPAVAESMSGPFRNC